MALCEEWEEVDFQGSLFFHCFFVSSSDDDGEEDDAEWVFISDFVSASVTFCIFNKGKMEPRDLHVHETFILYIDVYLTCLISVLFSSFYSFFPLYFLLFSRN